MRRRYIDGPYGQIHLRETSPAAASKPPLICLNPAPSSGAYFTTLMPLLAAHGRAVIAPDYPGYGASDPTPAEPTIADYARSTAAVADDISADAPIDMMGFHTGCLVAIEAALQRPERVRRLVLIDVPYFEAEARPGLRDKMGAAPTLSWDLDESLATVWAFSVAQRREHMPLARAYGLFIEHARAGAGMNAAFRAAFSYPCEERFAQLRTPTTIVATQSGLLEPTRRTAAALPHARFVERLDVDRAVMEIGAPTMVEEIARALDAD